jgi:hypothetical protein
MNPTLTVFLVGTLGGALGELLKWYQLRESPNMPEYSKKLVYWFVTALMALAGGVLALLYGIDPSKLLLALNVGISAPLILKGLAAAAPNLGGAAGAKDLEGPKPTIGNFIAGK